MKADSTAVEKTVDNQVEFHCSDWPCGHRSVLLLQPLNQSFSSFGTIGFQAQLVLFAVKARKSKSWRNKDIPSSIHEAHVLAVLSRHLGPRPGRETHGGHSEEEQTRPFSEDRSRCRERLHTAPHALIIGSENETEENQEPHVCCSETPLHYIPALEARWRAPLRGWFAARGASRVKCGAHQSTFCSMTLVV